VRLQKTVFAVCLTTLAVGVCSAQRLSEVKSIFVDSFGNAEGADIIREKVINRIAKSGKVQVVDALAQADAILTGIGEITRGARYQASSGTYGGSASGGTTYDATLVLRLVTKEKQILWSDEAKPGGFSRSVSSSVADRVVKSLLRAIEKDAKSKK
jgi:hypothetical protein